jgi:hypothetical protein
MGGRRGGEGLRLCLTGIAKNAKKTQSREVEGAKKSTELCIRVRRQEQNAKSAKDAKPHAH